MRHLPAYYFQYFKVSFLIRVKMLRVYDAI
jgi:hypothetical protein